MNRPALTIGMILGWADAYRERTGTWPTSSSGRVIGARGENWRAIDGSLRYGHRGLPGGSSLGLLLAEHRGQRAPTNRKPLTIEQVLAWADAYRGRIGSWPTEDSGPIAEDPEETWKKVNMALRLGARGLPAGRSLGRLLAEERGARNRTSLPGLTIEQILAWADAHHARTGQWPGRTSGAIPEAPGENWGAIALAVRNGYRGLSRGTTLPRLLLENRPRAAPGAWREEVVRRYQAGESLKRLGLTLGVSPETVRQELARRGVSRRTRRTEQLGARVRQSDRRQLGRRVRQARETAGLTQRDLAERSGVSPLTVLRVEAAHACPTRATLSRLAQVLGIDLDSLLSDPRSSR